MTNRLHAEQADTLLASESAARSTSGLAPGARVGRYDVLQRLGAGAMGVVYRARDARLSRDIAVKMLHSLEPGASACQSMCSLLMQEGLTMARLSHPNLVTVFDVGQFNGCVYVAMELVDGITLREWAGGKPWRAVLAALLDAGRGLEAAHAAGVVHRDFKPDNVLLGSDGRARVTDFGIARSSRDLEAPEQATSCVCGPSLKTARIADEQAIVGTPRYMPPEQYMGTGVDSRADQFSFAVTCWELLYAEEPVTGDTLQELWASARVASNREPPPHTEVPARVAEVLRRALSAEASRRFTSMKALLEALDSAARASAD